MTWKELKTEIEALTPEQLKHSVTIYDSINITFSEEKEIQLNIAEENDIIPKGYPFLRM